MKKSLPKAQLGKIVKQVVKSAKKLKAAASEKMWPTKNLRRMEDWDAHYRKKAQDKFQIGVGAGFGTAGAAGAAANARDKKKEAERKKTAPKKQMGGEKHPLAEEGKKLRTPSKRTMRMVKRAVKKQNKRNPGRFNQGM